MHESKVHNIHNEQPTPYLPGDDDTGKETRDISQSAPQDGNGYHAETMDEIGKNAKKFNLLTKWWS